MPAIFLSLRTTRRPAGFAHDIRSHGSQLNVGVRQRFVDAIDDPRMLARQLRAMPGQIAQFPLGAGRHEAAAQQPTVQQLGNPLAILDIALATGYPLQRTRIDQ